MRRGYQTTLMTLGLSGVVMAATWQGCLSEPALLGTAELRPDLEVSLSDGSLFTPSTQSFGRGHHALDGATAVSVRADDDGLATLSLEPPGSEFYFRLHNLPLRQLVPRLHYAVGPEPDAFDAMNLLLAEYSRNGLSVPQGSPGDQMAHFETDLDEDIPWSLRADYDFVPNPRVRPVRASVVNNCLAPGLWEFVAADRTGQLHHSWFDFPSEPYRQLVAEVNGLDEGFVSEALTWRTEPVAPDLSRLRTVDAAHERVGMRLAADEDAGFSSQGSRRKLARGYAHVDDGEGGTRRPTSRSELVAGVTHLVDFSPPGRYDPEIRKPFDLRFLGDARYATVSQVTPRTSYRMEAGSSDSSGSSGSTALSGGYLEVELALGDDRRIVLGNLPVALLVPQEDFTLHGFGVGILAAGGFAERRALLLDRGPAPSFAYLLEGDGDDAVALNSHEAGIEQVFIRTHIRAGVPRWEITVTSFERITDLVKYEVEVPEALWEPLNHAARVYVSPLYLTYRDDNLR